MRRLEEDMFRLNIHILLNYVIISSTIRLYQTDIWMKNASLGYFVGLFYQNLNSPRIIKIINKPE